MPKSLRPPERHPPAHRPNTAPRPAISIRRTAGEPRLFLFDASGSRDPGGFIAEYRWRLPDGVVRHLPVVRYRVVRRRRSKIELQLTVVDNQGAQSHRSVVIYPPLPAFVLFKLDRAEVLPEGQARLMKLAHLLGDVVKVTVEGHTDSTGSERHNQSLSTRRADAVAEVLERRLGLPERKVKARGFGERVPIASNETAAGRRLNRRVEVLVVR
jgi:outer membrane protein OmpA-like peptidoglycan-associated protein